jgi:hypothetical protein
MLPSLDLQSFEEWWPPSLPKHHAEVPRRGRRYAASLLFVGRRFWGLLGHHWRLLDLLDGSILCSELFLALVGRQRWRIRSVLIGRAAISLLSILRGIHLVFELLQFLVYFLL